MPHRRIFAALALGVTAVLGVACADTVAPRPRDAHGHALLSAGLKLGQCFLQVGLTGTQGEPGADGNATLMAPPGEVVTRVAVKAGTSCWFTPPGAAGTYTISVDGAPCYIVNGLGSAAATVTRVGNGPACKDISHVELVSATAPPATGLLQICVTVVGDDPPPAALTFAFPFVVAGQQLSIAHGGCAEPIEVPEGQVVITEGLNNPFGILLGNAVSVPDGRVVGVDMAAGTATVIVVAGSTTVVTITNVWMPDPGGDG